MLHTMDKTQWLIRLSVVSLLKPSIEAKTHSECMTRTTKPFNPEEDTNSTNRMFSSQHFLWLDGAHETGVPLKPYRILSSGYMVVSSENATILMGPERRIRTKLRRICDGKWQQFNTFPPAEAEL